MSRSRQFSRQGPAESPPVPMRPFFTSTANQNRPHPLRVIVAFALVLVHVASAVGLPQVRFANSGGCAGGACGCGTSAVSEGCCCSGSACRIPAAPPPPTQPCGPCGQPRGLCCCSDKAPPKVERCPRCKDETQPSTPAVTESDAGPFVVWVSVMKARQCRGEGPLGIVAEEPSAPPQPSIHLICVAGIVGSVDVVDSRLVSTSHIPEAPPPRSA